MTPRGLVHESKLSGRFIRCALNLPVLEKHRRYVRPAILELVDPKTFSAPTPVARPCFLEHIPDQKPPPPNIFFFFFFFQGIRSSLQTRHSRYRRLTARFQAQSGAANIGRTATIGTKQVACPFAAFPSRPPPLIFTDPEDFILKGFGKCRADLFRGEGKAAPSEAAENSSSLKRLRHRLARRASGNVEPVDRYSSFLRCQGR